MNNLHKLLLWMSIIALASSILLPINVVHAQQELFKVTIIAPGNANLVRRQWGQIFANSLRLLGIDARIVFLPVVPSCYDRVFTPPLDIVGKTYDEGGFDIFLIGWTPGLIPEPRQLYYGGEGFLAPYGQNYELWNNARSNQLLDQFITSTDPAEQNASLQEWQSVFFEDLPASQIVFQSSPAVVNPVLSNIGTTANGEGWLYFNAQPNPEYLKGKTSVVYASTGEFESLIPPASNLWYDTIVNAVIFNGLAQVSPDLSDLSVPALLESWTPSENGFKWTFNLRHGVKWHDGYDFTADDVLFTLWALMNGNTRSQFVGYYQNVYGNNVKFTWENTTSTTLGTGSRMGNVTAIDPFTVEVWLPVLANAKPYGYFDPYLLTFANNIIPKHIFENIVPTQWSTTPFNTGQGTIVIPGVGTYNGPVGTGPYKWVSFDPVTQLVHVTKFADYWNRTGLEAEGMFQVQDYYIKYIADKTAALASLKNGDVDMLDANYQMQVDVPSIDPAWGRVLMQEGTGRQEIGYNMRHPVIGTGVNTPLGQATPARAAEAARYIRTAFDYAIPRQLIIDNLLSGFGTPGTTGMLPSQPYYNSSITSRPYDLAKAREFLQKAGYTVPGPPPPPTVPAFILGMSTTISGTYTGSDGLPLTNRQLDLMVSNQNSTTALQLVATTRTDLRGFYSFTITPSGTGVFYYYLFDFQAPIGTEFKYLTSANVSSLQDAFNPVYNQLSGLQNQTDNLNTKLTNLQNSLNTMTYIAIAALVLAVVLGGVAIILPRYMKKKP